MFFFATKASECVQKNCPMLCKTLINLQGVAHCFITNIILEQLIHIILIFIFNFDLSSIMP